VWLVAPSEFSGSKPSWACFAEHPVRNSASPVNADAATTRIARFESKIDPSDIKSLPFNPTLEWPPKWLIQPKIRGFSLSGNKKPRVLKFEHRGS
jgi:hypothetical protein